MPLHNATMVGPFIYRGDSLGIKESKIYEQQLDILKSEILL